MEQNQSKLQTWIQCDDVNGGIPFSNFNSPKLQLTAVEPEFIVNWSPTKAIYTLKYPEMDVITEIFVPFDKATVCLKTKIVNKLDKDIKNVEEKKASAIQITPEIEDLLEQRKIARAEKNWAKSDEIRDKLQALGIGVKDLPNKEIELIKL